MVTIKLKNLDGVDVGEYIETDGTNHILHSSYGIYPINRGLLEAILRDHSNISICDLGTVLLTECVR